MAERRETAIAFGPVGLAGVVADVTVAELGGFKAMNEPSVDVK